MIIRLQVLAIAILIFLSGCTKTNESPTEALERLSKLEQDREIQRLNREKIEQKREQDERLAREKEDSISLRTALTPLIKSRKQRIKEETENLITVLKNIAADRSAVNVEMSLVEDKRGLEYTVFNIMTNPTLNSLAVKYTGSDFNTLRSEYVEAVRFHKTSHTELTQALKQNHDEYRKQVTGVDQDVDNATTAAQTSIVATHANIQNKITELEQKKAIAARRYSGRTKSAEIEKIDDQLSRLYTVLEVSTGSTLHIKASSHETAARRKYDTALEDKTVKDSEVLKTSQFKGDLYNAAQTYRGRSIDGLLNVMTTQAAILSEKLSSAEMVLSELEDSEERMSLMDYSDLIKLRENIAHDARIKLEDNLNAPAKAPLMRKQRET